MKKIIRESLLKKNYRDRMIYGLSVNGETRKEWILYDLLLIELRKIGEDILIDEIRYRVSDNESPVIVISDIFKKLKNRNKIFQEIEKDILIELNNKLLFKR